MNPTPSSRSEIPANARPRIIALFFGSHGKEEYAKILNRIGGAPLMVSNPAILAEKFDLFSGTMQGLFLSGDEDVDPDYYEYADEHAYDTVHTRAAQPSPERQLMAHALAYKIPILATGRGCLELNEAMGGRTNLDVNVGLFSTIRHAAFENYQGHRHQIFMSDDTPLKTWLGTDSIRVSSQHHQGIKTLAPGLIPMAHAADGMIEAYYSTAEPFVVGLQFRPEIMLKEDPRMEDIFHQFIQACMNHRLPPVS